MSQIDLNNLDLTDDPDTQNAVFLAAFNSGEGSIFDQLYLDDAISNLSGGPLSGPERTKAIIELLATKPELESTVKHSYVAGDTSLVIVDFHLKLVKDGKPLDVHGTCTDVLVRDSRGKWMMAVDRPIADVPSI